MGKGAKAGKRNPKQKAARKLTDEARQISIELESNFAKRMLPIAVSEAFILLLNIACIVLHDDYGFGRKRLGDFVEHVMSTWECVPEYVTINELADEVTRMTGCSFTLRPQEAELMKEYGFEGLAREVQLNENQRGVIAAKRAAGWR